MNTAKINTVDDFENLSDDEKNHFKKEHSLAYNNLFAHLNLPKAGIDWRDHRAELNFFPSDIQTPDDFEKLTPAGQQYLKEQFPLVYKSIWDNNK